MGTRNTSQDAPHLQDFSIEQYETLTGLMLGDGGLEKVSKTKARLRIERQTADLNYLKMHQDLFKYYLSPSSFSEREKFDKKKQKTYYSIRLKTLSNTHLARLYNLWYPNGMKRFYLLLLIINN